MYTLAGLGRGISDVKTSAISSVSRFPARSARQARPIDIEVEVASPLLIKGWSRFTHNHGSSKMAAQQQPLDVLQRVQGEYIEMPGLRLTTAQAQRLWGLDRAACDALLGALVDAKFLFRTRDGAFVRSDARTHS
jgi:hypothetical protein